MVIGFLKFHPMTMNWGVIKCIEYWGVMKCIENTLYSVKISTACVNMCACVRIKHMDTGPVCIYLKF